MCGIVGFIGSNAIKHCVHGLRSLEYRGYDSAGVAAVVNSDFYCTKRVGKLNKLVSSIDFDINSNIAVCHTRWATHGGVTEENAHPHIVGDIAVVHNGIIDNFLELKESLISSGAVFNSDTDTEVIAHLISRATGTLYERVRAATLQLIGSYAIAVVSNTDSGVMVAARKSSPLLIGKFESGAMAASDIQAILPHTSNMIVMDDNDIAIITKNSIRFFNNDVEIAKSELNIPWTTESVGKGKFNTFMEKEIYEQPAAITNTILKNDWQTIRNNIGAIIKPNSKFIFTACGTSFHACNIGSHLIERDTSFESKCVLASELKFGGCKINENSVVVAVSQSGETADTLMAIKYAKNCGAKIISVINVLGSSLSRESDVVIYTAAGPEVSVASTKAFTAQLSVLMMLFGILSNNEMDNIKSDIFKLAENMPKTFEYSNMIMNIGKSIINKPSALFLGRGINVITALEGALKLKEISYIHAEGMSSAELKHGPIAMIKRGYPVFMILPKDDTYDKAISNMHEVLARGARVIALVDSDNESLDGLDIDVIKIPKTTWFLTPMAYIVPLQLIALYTAWYKGNDIDQPKNLAKSVTVE